MARKKPESMLTRQRRLLKEQRAKKAAAKAAKANASKSLPSRGQTGGNSLKSRSQRKGTAKRVAGQQQRVISEAMRKTMKQRQALDKQEAAAKGSKGSKVQTGTRTKGGSLARQGSSAVKSSRKGAAASTRVQKVKVKVEPQKALKAGSQKALPPAKKALPAGKKGGGLATTKGPRRTNVNTNSSGGKRTGQPGPNRGASAEQMRQATRRAGTQARKPGRGGLLAPLALGSAVGAWMNENLSRRPTPNGRGSGRATDTVKPGPSNKAARQQSSNTTAAANARIKKQRAEREKAKSRSGGNNNSQILRPAPAASKPAPTRTPARSGAASTRSGAASTPSKAPQSKNMDANYKAWAKANPALAKKVKKGQAGYNAINNKPTPSVPANRGAGNGAPGAQTKKTEPAKPKKAKSALETAAERRKKKKKSAANRAGWQGNRNY